MRKFLIPLLLATALAPAAASAKDSDFLRGLRAQSERSDEPTSRSSESRTVTQHSDSGSGAGHRDYHRDARQEHREFHATDPSKREHRQYHREAERDHRTEHRAWDRNRSSGSHGDYHDEVSAEHDALHASDPSRREHREWHRDANRQHDRLHQVWDTNWRTNSRYNWYDYRSRYGSLFRLGRYYDPYGWGYRRFSIGFSLWPSYYGSNYWMNDPWQYRLPPAYGPYRWVRYYDDALLVNIYTGQVVDVIYNFFW